MLDLGEGRKRLSFLISNLVADRRKNQLEGSGEGDPPVHAAAASRRRGLLHRASRGRAASTHRAPRPLSARLLPPRGVYRMKVQQGPAEAGAGGAGQERLRSCVRRRGRFTHRQERPVSQQFLGRVPLVGDGDGAAVAASGLVAEGDERVSRSAEEAEHGGDAEGVHEVEGERDQQDRNTCNKH